jgi:tight adherence protein B
LVVEPRRWTGGSRTLARARKRLGRRGADVRYEDALPGALDHAAAAMRAGASTVDALGAAASVADPAVRADLTDVVRRVERGASLEAALDEWCRGRPLAPVELTAIALGLGARFGGRQAAAVDAIGDTLRTRIGLRREVRALSAQARASAWVMSATPFAFAVVAAALDPRVASVLVASPLGWACLAAGVALNGAGAVWMARITGAAP